jgi:hypothetical protein
MMSGSNRGFGPTAPCSPRPLTCDFRHSVTGHPPAFAKSPIPQSQIRNRAAPALASSHTCPDPDALRAVLDRLARRNPNAHAVDPFSPAPSLPEDERLKAFGELLAKAAGVVAVKVK